MKEIILFGSGKIGQTALETVSKVSTQNISFCDNDVQKKGQCVNGVPVLSFEELLDKCKSTDVDIIISCADFERVYIQCIKNGIPVDIIRIFSERKKQICKYEEAYDLNVYSQDGEELFLREYFYEKKIEKGFYVDIGAHHPFRYSNTYWAYKKGWNGINIDANSDAIEKFNMWRPDDHNVHCGIASELGEMDYYVFAESGVNTFCRQEIENWDDIREIKKVPVSRLEDILNQYHVGEIDFMDIDVEGMEMQVLSSNDWEKYRPTIILCEQKVQFDAVLQSDIYTFLIQQGYKAVCKFGRTVIYEKNE